MLRSRMQININFLENLRLEALFDDFKVLADQPIRYKGDGSAPGPFDYFLASSALCAAYFVKVYCQARNISLTDISISQDNIVDPENRYKQIFHIQVSLPENISDKDKKGILDSIERCTVKRVIQNKPDFKISLINAFNLAQNDILVSQSEGQTHIPGKDCSLEKTIEKMSALITELGIKLEIASWRNPLPHVWSVHIRDADSPMCFTNGKGSSKDAALCSALGEFFERLSNNYFYNDFFLGQQVAMESFVHYPNEKWYLPAKDNSLPKDLMDDHLKKIYNPDGELKFSHLIDTNSANFQRGICAIPFTRQSDNKTTYIPINILGNLYVSNGMSAGNTKYEARVQCLSEIFERAIKNKIIREEISLPDVPLKIIEKYPHILDGIRSLEKKGFPILVKDASLGGQFPVLCVTLMNPKTGGAYASFGSHPQFEVALERSLTELLQGRSFEGFNDVALPSFNSYAVSEHNNIVEHFIDSNGVLSWRFFSSKSTYKFSSWDFQGTTLEEFDYLMQILVDLKKEVYICDFDDLGIAACRIIVPDFSEIYPIEDLIWDNNNRALIFRDLILKIHSLKKKNFHKLLELFDEYEIDDYMDVSELIGISFDESSAWRTTSVVELKLFIYLSLKDLENAKECIDLINAFNESSAQRKKFFQLLNICLDIALDDQLNVADYQENLIKMYGPDLFAIVIAHIECKQSFYELDSTDSNLFGLRKHLALIESYKKLWKKRNNDTKHRESK